MKCIYCNENLGQIEALEKESDIEEDSHFFWGTPKKEYVYNVLGYCPSCEKEFRYKVKLRTVLDSVSDLVEVIDS